MSARKAEAPTPPRDTRIPCSVCSDPLGHYGWVGKRYCHRHAPSAVFAARDRAESERAVA